NGIETCKQIRADPELAGLPVIFVTALDDIPSRIRGKEAGADDFLTKPVSTGELLARVRALLRAKAAADDREKRRAEIEAELDKTRSELLRAERLATLGTLAAGVGHELKNIAVVLRGVVS